jgi:hypothetical protein
MKFSNSLLLGFIAASVSLVGFAQNPGHGTAQRDYYMFGGDSRNVYLGCITCPAHDSESVSNPYGTYGSPYAYESIFNDNGPYGSQNHSTSACSAHASNPPVIYDEDKIFIGYLTRNPYKSEKAQGFNGLLERACGPVH